ncbi:hypothetical protein OH77DRAFT_1408860 [Trametes cingulata]|nr:hypothetical protein OH77DRAFT_1408860 [Trametes cingulata]
MLLTWGSSRPRPILDKAGRVFAVLAGRPRDATGWADVTARAQAAFEKARAEYRFNPTQVSHRRGEYPIIGAGFSYGGGQTRPSQMAHSDVNEPVVHTLLQDPAVVRLAGFARSAFQLYAPRLYGYYKKAMDILTKDGKLRRNFEKDIFAGVTFNLGPQVATYVHTDSLNLPAGWCAVIALGDFDPKEGGHLLLWDLKLIIEFPPGALIFIPSAVLRHSNTVVSPEEHRYSFTQYSAGGLFRWVECGCKSKKVFDAEGGDLGVTGGERWLRGVQMWSTWEELQGM